MNSYSFKFALFWLLLAFGIKVEAVRPVVLSCNNDESLEHMEEARGLQGFPGRRGPVGLSGAMGERGLKGNKGEMGETAPIPQALTDRIDDVTRQSAINLANTTSTVEQMQENLATLGEALTDQIDDVTRQSAVNLANITSTVEQMQEKLTNLEHELIILRRHHDCDDVAREGIKQSGLYNITINGRTVIVYCDIRVTGKKWLVIQRRQDGSEEFYRNWTEYERGFGNKSGEFWLGLENIHSLTAVRFYELRVDLEDWEGNTAYAVYSVFSVGNSTSNYTLNVGGYSGNAGDSMAWHNNHQFSTKDRDNDALSGHCAEIRHGAWWYVNCNHSNLNGRYYRDSRLSLEGVSWWHWKNNRYSMKRAEMKIRRI